MNQKRSVLWVAFFFAALFFVWAGLTFSGHLDAFDRFGLLLFRDHTGAALGGATMITAVTWVTHAGDTITLLIISVATLALLLYRGRRKATLNGAMAITGLFVLSPVLKWIFDRSRPDIVEHLAHASSNSFPSGHAIRSLALYLLVYLLLRSMIPPAARGLALVLVVCVAVATGISRLYLGVHWPTDVMASWLAALSWVFLWRGKLDHNETITDKS